MSVRVYVPLDEAGLRRIARQGELGPAPLSGYAVTPSLRASSASDDIDELEYAAMIAAGAESAAMRSDRGRRIVLAADVAQTQVDEKRAAGAVLLDTAISLATVASFHVAEGDDDQLSWYARQELCELIRLAPRG